MNECCFSAEMLLSLLWWYASVITLPFPHHKSSESQTKNYEDIIKLPPTLKHSYILKGGQESLNKTQGKQLLLKYPALGNNINSTSVPLPLSEKHWQMQQRCLLDWVNLLTLCICNVIIVSINRHVLYGLYLFNVCVPNHSH